MSTVDVSTSGDLPTALPVTMTDAIAAAQSFLAQCLSVLTQVNQTGLTVQQYAAIAQAAAAAAQSVVQGAYSRVAVADANRTGVTTDIYVEWTSLTAARTYQLPPAAQCQPGRPITLADASGSCSSTNTITPVLGGTDTFVGMSSAPSIGAAGGSLQLYPTSNNAWIVR